MIIACVILAILVLVAVSQWSISTAARAICGLAGIVAVASLAVAHQTGALQPEQSQASTTGGTAGTVATGNRCWSYLVSPDGERITCLTPGVQGSGRSAAHR